MTPQQITTGIRNRGLKIEVHLRATKLDFVRRHRNIVQFTRSQSWLVFASITCLCFLSRVVFLSVSAGNHECDTNA